jgi:glycosyltransferase involved in cell wall biosynthesis
MNADTEAFLWRKWDVLLAITPEEARVIEPEIRPSQVLLTVPHAMRLVALEDSTGDRVLYMGSDNPSNQQAVTWLLRDVWPQVRAARPTATLRLAGLICKPISTTTLVDTPGLELAGFVEDPQRELAEAAIVVAPYLYGSGLKIKVVETAGVGRALVTTTGGIEGTGLRADEHVLVSDDPEVFAHGVVRLLGDPQLRRRLTTAARAHVAATFSYEACYGPLLKILRARAEMPVTPGVIPPFVEQRLREALDSVRGQVVVWGNGSHTRALMVTLERVGATVRGIVDKNAKTIAQAPEGVPVMPLAAYTPGDDDLVVLSSQTFEAEMWEQAAGLRDAGTHVMALYRRELISDALQLRLRAKERERAEQSWGHGRSTSGSRLVIAEPSAGRSRGHFYRFTRSLRAIAPEIGADVLMAGARVPTVEGLEAEDRELLVPAFEFSHWDAVAEITEEPLRGISRFASLRVTELERLCERLTLTPNDVIVFLMANLVDVLAAGTWLAKLPRDKTPAVRMLFHFMPFQEAQWFKLTDQELRHAYGVGLAQLAEHCGNRLRLFAQSGALALDLTDALRWHVRSIGFPVPQRLHGASRPALSSPVRILYAGEARSDKGFGLLPGIAQELASERDAGSITIVCQSTLSEFADDAIRTAVQKLKETRGVELIDRFLPSTEYDDLIAGCDLILLPYDADQYRSRLSAIFVDATCAGVPVIVPEGTWMSRQLEEGLGAGGAFAALSPEVIAAVVRLLLPTLAAVKGDAHAASARAVAQHDPRAVLRALLES